WLFDERSVILRTVVSTAPFRRTSSVDPTPPTWFPEALAALLERCDLSPDLTTAVLNGLIDGECGDAEAAALLVAWRMKGETSAELAAAAAVLRRRMVRAEFGRDDLLDTCGTGGDGVGTFNISTAAALVASAAGAPVVKHGNRAVSGKCGSADVLAELGVPLRDGPEAARRSL